MKKALAPLLCILLVYYPTGFMAAAEEPLESANDLIKKREDEAKARPTLRGRPPECGQPKAKPIS